MRWLSLLVLVSLTAGADDRRGRFERFCGRSAQGRSSRGFLCDDYAFFEAFPSSGAGTTTACSTTPPTGAKGEVLTFARTGNATCTRTASGGLATTGIADGDLSEMSANQPRVEYDSSGVKGLRVESSRINSLFRFIEFGNVLWSDVGTPTLTGSQASPFVGTYATSAVQFDDNDAAGFEGRSQVVTVSAAAAYYAHCYVKAGTATSARIALDGTAETVTGLSSSTWSIVEVADASASAGTVTFEVDVGSTTAATGTVTFGGCQVEAGSYRTSIIPTTSAAGTRSVETATLDIGPGAPPANNFSFAVSVQREWTTTTPHAYTTAFTMSPVSTTDTSGKGAWLYSSSNGAVFSCLAGTDAASTWVSGNMSPTNGRAWCANSGGAGVQGQWGTAGSASAATPGTFSAARYLNIGNNAGSASLSAIDGLVGKICLDPNPLRCR